MKYLDSIGAGILYVAVTSAFIIAAFQSGGGL